ncbi:MAG: pantothenate kinase, partial [Fulvivirga sp.]
NSILSGIINGITAEIEQIIRMYSDKYGSLQIIICGGDSIFFEKRLKASIFAAPELVLRGLNGILQYNVS